MINFESCNKKIYYKIIILIIVTIISLLVVIKIPNFIYGLFYPPITLADRTSNDFLDNKHSFETVSIRYWDKDNNIMYFGIIEDQEVVDNIYKLVCETKVKQKLWNDDPISYNKKLKLIDKNACYLIFENNNERQYIAYVNYKYCNLAEMFSFNEAKLEIAEENVYEYLYEYLKDKAEEYDINKVIY